MNETNKIFVFTPANSMNTMPVDMIKTGVENLAALGFEVCFGDHVRTKRKLGVASIEDRLSDITKALNHSQVKIIMAVYGGYNSNDLLPYLDYDLIKSSGKIFMGYSDLTAILNAVYAEVGVPSILGMSFASFCAPQLFQNSIALFKSILNLEVPIEYIASLNAADDWWYTRPGAKARELYGNSGYVSLVEGEVSGPLIGGNLDTFCQLTGTSHIPATKGEILLIETAGSGSPSVFLRDMTHLKQTGVLDDICGLLIGKFHQGNPFTSTAVLMEHCGHLFNDLNIPVISNTHFSHVDPVFPAVIGGRYHIRSGNETKITLVSTFK